MIRKSAFALSHNLRCLTCVMIIAGSGTAAFMTVSPNSNLLHKPVGTVAKRSVSHRPFRSNIVTKLFTTVDEENLVTCNKERLLDLLSNPKLKLGFGDVTKSERDEITSLADSISIPTAISSALPNDSRWELLYASAPDFLGLRGGPLSRLISIMQTIDDNGSELSVIIEYAPSDTILELASNDFFRNILEATRNKPLEEERLEQTVSFYLTQNGGELDLRLKGTKITGDRFGGENWIPSPNLVLPDVVAGKGPLGSCRVLHNDGDLRIDRGGDYLGIYRFLS